MKKIVVNAFATGFGAGYAPFASGTIGSIAPCFIGYFMIKGDQFTLAVVAVISSIISVWSSGEAENYFGHDSKKIVIDEWAGMFITLLFIPYSLSNYLIGFIVFRALDVIKIFPARQAEKLPGGWGVTMDDVVAGIQSSIVTQLIIFLMARL
jgi:phosphatidylglycerophosphatase A